jgi:hypothetical protein
MRQSALGVLLVGALLNACAINHAGQVSAECLRSNAPRRERVMEHDILNDPHLRTWVHADALRTLVRRYVEDNGVLPSNLAVLTSLENGLPLLWDGWGYAFRYVRKSGLEYEIRGAGSDGVYCTDDDFVGTDHQFPPYPTTQRDSVG